MTGLDAIILNHQERTSTASPPPQRSVSKISERFNQKTPGTSLSGVPVTSIVNSCELLSARVKVVQTRLTLDLASSTAIVLCARSNVEVACSIFSLASRSVSALHAWMQSCSTELLQYVFLSLLNCFHVDCSIHHLICNYTTSHGFPQPGRHLGRQLLQPIQISFGSRLRWATRLSHIQHFN